MSRPRKKPVKVLDWRDTLIQKWLPDGWSLALDENLTSRGLCEGKAKKIRLQRFNNTAEDKLIFWHEVGHVVCGHMSTMPSRHIEEYEAEQFALFVARLEGVAVPVVWIQDAKLNVLSMVQADQNDRIPINQHVLNWASYE